jgi:hypothetical protein
MRGSWVHPLPQRRSAIFNTTEEDDMMKKFLTWLFPPARLLDTQPRGWAFKVGRERQ